ncbi:MAG: hypothetical protein NTU41_12390 [Chloroflexi bacterium]|nr:hypothetical protein [Chloroflexota bacterium]
MEEACCAAWERLRTTPRVGFDLLNADEDLVTQELYDVLYDEVFRNNAVDGFNRELFTTVTRESKVRNYDGTKLDKMPDLLVGMVDRPSNVKNTQDWLFIECKPVDAAHSVGVHYCDKGIIRFVLGEYAWAMTSALMIGYVRDGYTISSKLAKALEARVKQLHTIDLPCPCRRSKPGQNNEIVHVSRHSRTFSYNENGQQAPAITLRHLWLRRD